MKTVNDFKRQVKAKNITRWLIHDCSMCGYHCGYYFDGDKVEYDNGCGCSMQPRSPRTWDSVAEHYNMQTNKKGIKKMDEFWGFKN